MFRRAGVELGARWCFRSIHTSEHAVKLVMRDFIAFASCVFEAAAIDDRIVPCTDRIKPACCSVPIAMVTPDRPVPSIMARNSYVNLIYPN